jgi:Domain of unknown function (DUF305)
MKKVIVLAVAGLTLASVAAYAQMHHRGGPGMPTPQNQGPMMEGHAMGRGMMVQGMGHGMMHGGKRGGHGSAGQPKGDTGPSSLAFHGINFKMHEKMDITFTGDADVDFVKGMIPHHQGAIDMAKTVLAFGKDLEVRKLAEEVIKAQESEIALMQNWLKAKGH